MDARRVAGALLVGVLAAGTAGCGSGSKDAGGSMKITGNCGLGTNTLAVDRVLPASVLGTLIADADYRAVGGMVVRDDKLPAAYDGDCALQDSSGDDVLRLALINKTDPRYAEAQKALETGDQDGFTKVDATTYVIPDDGAGAARAVTVLPDRLVILRVLKPAEGIDAKKLVGTEMKTVVARVEALS